MMMDINGRFHIKRKSMIVKVQMKWKEFLNYYFIQLLLRLGVNWIILNIIEYINFIRKLKNRFDNFIKTLNK